jgi:hypothetical protein
VTQGGRGACVCRGRAGGDDQLAQRCCVVVQQGGWRYGWRRRQSTIVMLRQGGGSPKVAGAPLLCGGAAGGIGVGVVLQVGCARGALASSSQPRGRQWRSGAGSAGQQSTSGGLMEGGSSPEGTKASTKWLGRRRCVLRSTSMGTSRGHGSGAGPASTGAC